MDKLVVISWQSSSSKLEEGLSLAPLPGTFVSPVLAAATSGGGGGGGGSGGGGCNQLGPGAGAVGAMAPPSGDSYVSLPVTAASEQQQLQNHQQLQRPSGHYRSGSGGGAGGEDLRQSPAPGLAHQLQMGNGFHEPQQGTDASAALSEELCAVRRAVLANLSYAHLQAGDWCAALQAAKALLAVSTPAAAPGLAAGGGGTSSSAAATAAEYAFLAHNYAAEALCLLDRPAEAAEYLSLWLVTAQEREAQQAPQPPARSNSSLKSDEHAACGAAAASAGPTGRSGPGEDGEQCSYPLGNAAALAALSGPAALAATATNLGAVFASQGELQQAAALVRQALALQRGSRSAALLLVYCELAAGNTAAALALLKQRGPMAPPL